MAHAPEKVANPSGVNARSGVPTNAAPNTGSWCLKHGVGLRDIGMDSEALPPGRVDLLKLSVPASREGAARDETRALGRPRPRISL